MNVLLKDIMMVPVECGEHYWFIKIHSVEEAESDPESNKQGGPFIPMKATQLICVEKACPTSYVDANDTGTLETLFFKMVNSCIMFTMFH